MPKQTRHLPEVDEFLIPDWERVLAGQERASVPKQPWSAILAWNEASVVKVISTLLESANWQVTSARDGDEILKMVEYDRLPDIFIIDRQILPMRAHNLVAAMRAQGALEPVLVISAMGDEILEFENYSAPQPFFAPAPFYIDYLFEILPAALGQREGNRTYLPHTRWHLSTALGCKRARSELDQVIITADMSGPEKMPPSNHENINVWAHLQQVGFGKVTIRTTCAFLKQMNHSDILLSVADRIHEMTNQFQEAGILKGRQRLWMNAVYLNSFMAPAIPNLNKDTERYCNIMTKLMNCADPLQNNGQDVFLLMELFRCMPMFIFPVVDEFIDYLTSSPRFKINAVFIAWCALAEGCDPWNGIHADDGSSPAGNFLTRAREKRDDLESRINETNPHERT